SQTTSDLSRPVDASRLPSGLNARLVTSGWFFLRAVASLRVAGSDHLILPSWLADASRLPSGLNARLMIDSSCSLGLASWATPVRESKRLTLPSLPPVATYRPSGLMANAETPLMVAKFLPVYGSHVLSVPSLPSDASSLPSTLWATPRTASTWP